MKTKLLVLFTIITIVGVGMIVLKDNFGKYNKQVNYGYKLLETGKYEEAVLAFNKAITIDKKKDRAYVGLMDTYKKQNKEDAAQNIYNVASNAMLNVSDIEAIKQRYEAIRNEYIKETGKDVLPPTPEQNNTNLANNDNSETNIDTLQNGTDLSKDLYKSLEDELKAEYGMISNTKFNYSLTESSNNIISSGDGGIIRIIYDDLDNNGTDEMIVSRVENQNLAIEVYTVNDNDVNCVPIYCFNNSQEPGDYVTYEMFLTNKYEANANLFIKNLNGDKYLCLEYGSGLGVNNGDEDQEYKILDIYKFDGEKLYIISTYMEEIDFLWDGEEEIDKYIVSGEMENIYEEFDDKSEFIDYLKNILSEYDLSGLWSDRAYLTNYTDDREKHYTKASDRCSDIIDIINITSYSEGNDDNITLEIDTCN